MKYSSLIYTVMESCHDNNFCRSYLKYRSQFSVFAYIHLNCAVPQGCLIGPMFFRSSYQQLVQSHWWKSPPPPPPPHTHTHTTTTTTTTSITTTSACRWHSFSTKEKDVTSLVESAQQTKFILLHTLCERKQINHEQLENTDTKTLLLYYKIEPVRAFIFIIIFGREKNISTNM